MINKSSEKEKSGDKSPQAVEPNNLTSSLEGSSIHRSYDLINSSQNKNKKRVQKARVTSDFLRKLPEGITYHESCSSDDEEPRQVSEIDNDYEDEEFKEGDIIRLGKWRINIEKVTKQQLISMRKYLPATQYRLIKNRKTARLCRRKRKEERSDMQRNLEELNK